MPRKKPKKPKKRKRVAAGNRTAQGTAADKASGATLTISSVTITEGHCLVVAVGCENSQLAPTSVTHNGRRLRRKVQQNNATDGIHCSVWVKGEYKHDQSGDIVATWAAPIGKRVMCATSYDKAQQRDTDASKSETVATDNPATGRTSGLIAATALLEEVRYEIVTEGTTDFRLVGAPDNDPGTLFWATGPTVGTGTCREALFYDNDLVVSYFVSEGPGSDHGSSTARINTGGAWTPAAFGQQIGTNGGGAAANITLIETHIQVSSGSHIRSQLRNATSRKWASAALVLQERIPWWKMGITATDVIDVETIVKAAGGDTEAIYYGYEEGEARWEAYEDIAGTLTLRAFRRQRNGTWIPS